MKIKYKAIDITSIQSRIEILKNIGSKSKAEEDLHFCELNTLLDIVNNSVYIEDIIKTRFSENSPMSYICREFEKGI